MNHKKTSARDKFTRRFLRTMSSREKRLPSSTLHRFVEDFFQKKTPFLDSAREYGTPQYFYDEPGLVRNIAFFRRSFSRYMDEYHLFYALKSNSFRGLYERVVREGMGLDVSSGFELHMALATRCDRILFSGPGKTDEELALAVEHRSRVTLLMDSFGELGRVSEILSRRKSTRGPLRVGMRVRSQHRRTWDKFGIPLKDLSPMMHKAMTHKGIDPCGIQFHTSWNLEPTAHVRLIHDIGTHVKESLPRDLWRYLRFLDIGGGVWPEAGEWLNPWNTMRGRLMEILEPGYSFRRDHYLREARPLDDFAREIAKALKMQGPPLEGLELWMEPGRWISTPAMHILLRVMDKKDARTVITDGGINILGWERPLSEYIPIMNLSRPAMKEFPVRIFGSLCTPLDVWGTAVFGDGIENGDLLLVPDQGAYTYSLRQSFIKPRSRVIRYDGHTLEEVEKEEAFGFRHEETGPPS